MKQIEFDKLEVGDSYWGTRRSDGYDFFEKIKIADNEWKWADGTEMVGYDEHHLPEPAYITDELYHRRTKMDIKEAYKVMQENCGIEVGDKVKVERLFKLGEFGVGFSRGGIPNRIVGETGTVRRASYSSFTVDFDGESWALPFFALELVEKAKKEEMSEVDGKDYSTSTIK